MKYTINYHDTFSLQKTIIIIIINMRYNKVASYIHWTICKQMELQVTDKYYQHIPERVINVNGTAAMWYVPVITDLTIIANPPYIVLHDKKEICLLIDIAITDDSNLNTKETEKLSMYKDLEIEVSTMWKVRTKVVPVIIGALGTIEKGLDQNLQLLPGHP